jgi:hypothetical protein
MGGSPFLSPAFAGCNLGSLDLGLTPEALCLRLLRRLKPNLCNLWTAFTRKHFQLPIADFPKFHSRFEQLHDHLLLSLEPAEQARA